jgi:XisH protein
MARDKIHKLVRRALEKDGWIITEDPFYVESGGIEIEVNLAAEKFIVAEKGTLKIIVEIKALGKRSLLYDFHGAIGPYIDYRGAINDENIDRKLYLAIPESVFIQMTAKPFYERRLIENNVSLIIIDITNEIVTQWIR